MKRKIITTADGSKTIHIEEWNEQYHSKHGAINEALYVFINKGLQHTLELTDEASFKIMEIGFGTGLNAFLTSLAVENLDLQVDYVGVEAYPVSMKEVEQLNYVSQIDATKTSLFKKLHELPWEEKFEVSSNFKLKKRQQLFSEIKDIEQYHLIYFDAFGARVQPELWTKDIFQIMFNALKPKGVLVTYAAIGQVKRDMMSLGFTVERLQGPPGKRHMLRATK